MHLRSFPLSAYRASRELLGLPDDEIQASPEKREAPRRAALREVQGPGGMEEGGVTDLVWEVYGIKTPQAEFVFAPPRRWRFDYSWSDQRIAVEIEGGVWMGGRHTRGSGFVKDMEKYNAAGLLGWRVFRFTPKQLKTGEAQAFMRRVFDSK